MNKIQNIWIEKRCYFILVVACLVFFSFSPQISDLLAKVVTWIEPCVQWSIVRLIFIAGSYLTIRMSYKLWQRKQYVSGSTFATSLFLIIVYSFYRCPIIFEFITKTTDVKFEFWPVDASLKWTDIFYLPFVLLIAFKFIPKKKCSNVMTKTQLLPDNPICMPEEDVLGYDMISEGLLKDLNATDVSKQSYSVGIVGSWGQGKSSFLNLFKHHAENQGSIVVTFNPRSSKSTKMIQNDFFNRFKEELSNYHTGIERHISNYAKEVAISDEGWIGKAALAINELSQTKEKERINRIIEQLNRKIFVIIEDLDRLTGKEILEVLKLIDANGDFCHTIYLTAYDKKYVNEVLNKYLDATPDYYYTDKYFNYEYLLPVSIHDRSESYFRRIAKNVVLPDTAIFKEDTFLDAWYKMSDTIVSYLPNIRHIKRYYNIFASRFLEVANDVDVSDFMLLTLLRYNDIAAYNSLVRFSFLRRGIVGDGSDKMIYLRDDYQNNETFKSLMPDSKKIIEDLFSVAQKVDTTLLTKVYNRLRWADSFKSYFSDFRIGNYHLEDFYDLFTLPENEAFDKLKEMYSAGFFTQVEDFLNSRDYNWIVNEAELKRMIKLIAYLDSLERSLNLQVMLQRFNYTSAGEEYIKSGATKDSESYKHIVLTSFQESFDTCSMEICFTCQMMLNSINSQQLKANEVVFSVQELTDLAVSAQRAYYSKYPDGDYIFNAILNLTNIREVQGQKLVVVKDAQVELIALMKRYPDKFAKDVVWVSPPYDNYGQKYINLRFIENFNFRDYLPEEEFTLYDWISCMSDKTAAYVVEAIVEKAYKNEILTIPALKSVYTQGDFDGLYEAIKAANY